MLFRKALETSIAVLLVGSFTHLPSQAHVRTLPKVLTGGFANSWGTSSEDSLSQLWYREDNLPQPPFPITQIAQRACRFHNSSAQTYDLTVTLDNSGIGYGALSTNPAKNLSAKASVLFRGRISIPAANAITDPNQVQSWVPLVRPFVFLGRHLIVQMERKNLVGGPRYGGVLSMDSSQFFTTTSGKSCGGNLSASYSGGAYGLRLTNGQPNVLALFMLSTENVQWGSAKFPINLSPAGMTGCELGIVPQILVPAATDRTGFAQLTVPIGLPKDPLVASAQALHQTQANAAGWASTNVASCILGSAGLANGLWRSASLNVGPVGYNLTLPIFVR